MLANYICLLLKYYEALCLISIDLAANDRQKYAFETTELGTANDVKYKQL